MILWRNMEKLFLDYCFYPSDIWRYGATCKSHWFLFTQNVCGNQLSLYFYTCQSNGAYFLLLCDLMIYLIIFEKNYKIKFSVTIFHQFKKNGYMYICKKNCQKNLAKFNIYIWLWSKFFISHGGKDLDFGMYRWIYIHV